MDTRTVVSLITKNIVPTVSPVIEVILRTVMGETSAELCEAEVEVELTETA